MHRLAFIFALVASVVASLLCGNAGFALPALPMTAFYFAMRNGPRPVLPWAVAAAAFTDALWRHDTPQAALAVLAVCGIAGIWRKSADTSSLATTLLGGLLCGFVNTAAAMADALLRGRGDAATMEMLFLHSLVPALAAMALLPPMAWFFNELLGRRIVVGRAAVDDEAEIGGGAGDE